MRISSGIESLDIILNGGFLPKRSYLIRGGPGSGKTTFCLHFLIEGVKNNENVLFITFGEPSEKIKENAKAIGLSPEGIVFLDLAPSEEFFVKDQTYDIFSPADVERGPTVKTIVETVEKVKPSRVVIDSVTYLRFLAPDVYQYRKQVLSLIDFLTDRGATVLFTSESGVIPDDDLQFIADGVIDLIMEMIGVDIYRRLSVKKFRGSSFLPGYHLIRIGHGGIRIYPRILPQKIERKHIGEKISTGIKELDEMTNGGINRQTITVISGAAGTGKTTLAMRIAYEAALRGENVTYYAFEEDPAIILSRAKKVGMERIRELVEKSLIKIVFAESLKFAPEEALHITLKDLRERNTKLVIIDSLNGAELALVGAEDKRRPIQAILRNLVANGATVILIDEFEANSRGFTRLGVSYLADNIIVLGHYVKDGVTRKYIRVVKMRLSKFSPEIRDFEITSEGIKIGERVKEVQKLC